MLTLRFLSSAEWLPVAAEFEDHGFEQSLTYGQAAAARIGAQARFVAIEQAGRPVAAACVRLKTVPGLGRGIAWIAAGPLTLRKGMPRPDAAGLAEVLSALRQQFCRTEGHVLRLRLPAQALYAPDLVADAMAEAGFHATSRSPVYGSAAIDLHKDEAQLLAALDAHWRRNLRFAQKSDLSLDRGDDAALQARFLTLFEAVKTAKGFRPDITPEFHFALSGPDYRHEIMIATKDGVDLAGSVVGRVGSTAVYLFGATAEAGRPLRAGYFLHWKAIGLSRERGLSWYDLGGMDAVTNPDVTRFKEQMNGVPLLAHPFEADGGGFVPDIIRGLESLRKGMSRGPRR
jgi:lipid II:glycine glycyltransferase (peptidoglycan interpeptide bridge formation enzyme)